MSFMSQEMFASNKNPSRLSQVARGKCHNMSKKSKSNNTYRCLLSVTESHCIWLIRPALTSLSYTDMISLSKKIPYVCYNIVTLKMNIKYLRNVVF